uniref:hypothetical chloroplast RF19 n=1 Tax=Pyrola atropurpurea TaxID=642525 RepID=UPI00315DC952
MIIKNWILENGLIIGIKNRIHIVTNSPIGLGLYYGFLSTIPISPIGLLFILWVQIIEKNSNKRLAAIKGFILGQLGIFIVIYYEPLFVALSMQSEFSSGIIPIFFIHFFSKIQILWKIEIIKPTDERTELLIHFIFQLLNYFLLPNSRLVGLVKIFLSQRKNNNKILFLTCSVVGWLIGLTFFIILFVNFFEFVLVLVRKNPFIKKKNKIKRIYWRSTL